MALGAFQKLEKIGEGTYGVVYKAREKETGRLVALKKIRPESENEGVPATTIREVIILKNLKHPNIIDLMEVVHCDEKMYLVFEYIESDLKKLMTQFAVERRRFDQKTIKKIARQMCSALAFCHSKNIFHRDLKPQNVLIDTNYDVKIGDFGLARAASIPLREYTTEIVTLWYRPPELLLGSKYYDASIDMWALGCILVELNTLEPLFMGDSEIDQLHKIFRILGRPDKGDFENLCDFSGALKDFPDYTPLGYENLIPDPQLAALVKKMLKLNPLKRVTAAEALNEEYFSS